MFPAYDRNGETIGGQGEWETQSVQFIMFFKGHEKGNFAAVEPLRYKNYQDCFAMRGYFIVVAADFTIVVQCLF